MRYFKPKSLTFWCAVTPFFAGLIVALASVVPELEKAATVINIASGGLTPPVLINLGLAGIGLRGAIK